ncbi:MAG: hypothetical protein JST98_08255, partial [Bacteroidetes bacterium]|nr:hypothetical protein [Bacteroidota bacterium]
MLRGAPFIIIMALGLIQLFASLVFVTSMYGNTTYPVTYNVAELMRGSLMIYLLIIVAFYAGQLVWKEREPKIDGIVNALPVFTAVNLLAKLAALLAVVLLVLLVAVLAGMATQLIHGYTRLQPGVYLTYFVLPSLLNFAIWAAVGLLVHVLVNNKYLGYFIFIVVFVLNIFVWGPLGVVSNLVVINGSSGLTYSDMNGFGPFMRPWLFFKAYWLLFGALAAYAAFLFAVRGNDTAIRWRLRTAGGRVRATWPAGALVAAAFATMAAIGWYNTKVVNTYRNSDETEALQVRYEQEYKKYEGMPQPHFTDLSYFITLDPAARAMSYSVDITVRNKH